MRGPARGSAARRGAALAVGLCAIACLACATSGRRFDADKLQRIEEGRTTTSEIEDWFGQPISFQRRSRGFLIYRYLHEEESVRDTRTFSRILAYAASFFGYYSRRAPVNVRYANTVRHELLVLFDPEGVVSTYAYERSEIPSHEIY